MRNQSRQIPELVVYCLTMKKTGGQPLEFDFAAEIGPRRKPRSSRLQPNTAAKSPAKRARVRPGDALSPAPVAQAAGKTKQDAPTPGHEVAAQVFAEGRDMDFAGNAPSEKPAMRSSAGASLSTRNLDPPATEAPAMDFTSKNSDDPPPAGPHLTREPPNPPPAMTMINNVDATNTHSTTPRRSISGAASARRQAAEQKAVGRILSGLGLVFLTLAVLVIVCAGVGGYVLWRQIQAQDLNLTLLQDRTNERITKLEKSLQIKDAELELMLQRLNARVGNLTTNLESFQTETRSALEASTRADARHQRLISNLNWKTTQQDREINSLKARLDELENPRRR